MNTQPTSTDRTARFLAGWQQSDAP
ncbi:MAG: hypothetical protein RLZZ494_2596, partial [Pseudomonadota bacterium]